MYIETKHHSFMVQPEHATDSMEAFIAAVPVEDIAFPEPHLGHKIDKVLWAFLNMLSFWPTVLISYVTRIGNPTINFQHNTERAFYRAHREWCRDHGWPQPERFVPFIEEMSERYRKPNPESDRLFAEFEEWDKNHGHEFTRPESFAYPAAAPQPAADQGRNDFEDWLNGKHDHLPDMKFEDWLQREYNKA